MGKSITFQTRSLGSEPDTGEDCIELAAWIQSRAGLGGDLVRYRFVKPVKVQREAGIGIPCTGGIFYGERLKECLLGIDNGKIVNELGLDPVPVKTDIEEVVRKPEPLWVALPCPGLLGITDGYYGDPDEASGNLYFQFRRLMREMRDSGADGSILICNQVNAEEAEAMCGKKMLVYARDPSRDDLELLLEYQRTIAVPCPALDMVISLKEEYPVDYLVLIDPSEKGLEKALAHWEADQILAGGYCREHCRGYWHSIVTAATYQVNS